jgi:hypothetical protein
MPPTRGAQDARRDDFRATADAAGEATAVRLDAMSARTAT